MTRRSGGTPSSGTGPVTGPGGARTYYYYAETSSPRQTGDVFELVYDGSTDCANGVAAVTFQYSMYGATMGTLAVVSGSSAPSWSKRGDQGSRWQTSGQKLGQQIGNLGSKPRAVMVRLHRLLSHFQPAKFRPSKLRPSQSRQYRHR